ncbi:Kiwa anti-phage protein KwaB-like domain-containing protein [Vagococcus fessus]|uniref:DUF4868 domain-containing protein n=1 Tax=Vagococcus fessus TaxID=120370 RepID=A0A430A6D0_9ENTE|nr:Kiwa anti-phage protein KwaB-like domain-containing protein [Vagococcus fessus]RSU02418.1 hypothetical protein CBF31_08600 [Vagococcus fessus]
MKSTSTIYNELLELLEGEGHGITFYLSRHVKQDEKYKTIEYDLSDELKGWLIDSIFKEIKMDEIKELENIKISEYNHEFNINDSVVELVLSDSEFIDIKEKKELLISSVNTAPKNESILNSNFQIIKVTKNEDVFYTCYYRGIKRSSKRKKYLSMFEGHIKENVESFFDIGGNLSFIIFKERIFIFRVKDFERSFKYNTHITEKRDENIEQIIEMDIFSNLESAQKFKEKSSNHLYARGLAEMKKEQLEDLKSNYQDRCNELNVIKKSLELKETNKDELREENGVLLDLLEFIDFENDNKIEIADETNITPLLHFLQDKIVESFLTKKVKTIIGYQKGD